MRRPAPWAFLLLALLGVLLASSIASASLADRIGATFISIGDEFIRTFQPVEGLIVSVDTDGALYVDLGETAGARVGQEFTVFRKGEEFRHPLTGKVIGRYEEVLGYAQVKRVHPSFSVAAFVPVAGKSTPRPEDGVRITRGRIKVAVAPLLDLTNSHADFRRVPYLLGTVLERSKRFQVVDPLMVSDMFANGSVRVEEMLARPERATRVAKNLDVAGWVVPILIERGGTTFLDVTWISAITGTALFSRRQALLPASALEEQRFPWEPAVED